MTNLAWIQPVSALVLTIGGVVLLVMGKDSTLAMSLIAAGGFATPSRNIGAPRE